MSAALKLLTPDEDRIPSVAEKYFTPALCGFLGFTGACYAKWATRRPVFSGIQVHLGLTLGGLIIGSYVDYYRNNYLAERDAVLRRYIELHPDDFPDPERKKYADVLQPWNPIR